jgi:hypothetical protein
MIIGIDNGLDGGIVALSPIAGLSPIAKFTMPTRSVTYPARKKTAAKVVREIDTRGLVAILEQIEGPRDSITVYFEHCPFHADRAETMRSMALSAGKILAVLEAKNFKTIRILSFDWHPVILGKVPRGETKAYAKAKALDMWPQESWTATERSTKAHDGMIDAALIAEYGRIISYPATGPASADDNRLPW